MERAFFHASGEALSPSPISCSGTSPAAKKLSSPRSIAQRVRCSAARRSHVFSGGRPPAARRNSFPSGADNENCICGSDTDFLFTSFSMLFASFIVFSSLYNHRS